MADIFSLVGRVSIEYAQAETALERVSDAAEDTADSLEEVGDASEDAGGTTEQSGNRMVSALKKIGAAVVAAFAVDKIVDFGKSLVEASATVAAEQSAFEQIMGDYSDTAQQKMNEIADTTGMVSTRLTPYMTSMTAKFKGLGYDIDDATTLAQDGLSLAADAAAFWDKSLDDSMGALNSFINGSYEGGEAIGLFANDTQLASYAVKQGIVSETKEWANLDEAKKQATRLQYAQDMMAASGATGQAAKEADQYANVQANLTEKWRQFKAQIGESILQNVAIPAMNKLSGVVDKASVAYQKCTKWISDHKKELEIAKGVLIGLTVAVGSFLLIMNWGKIMATAKAALLGIKTAMLAVNAAMAANPIGLVISLIAGLVAGFIYLWNTSEEFRNFWIGLWETIKTAASGVWEAIKGTALAFWDWIKTTAESVFNALNTGWETVKSVATSIWDAISTACSTAWETIKNIVSVAIQFVGNIISFGVQLWLAPWIFIWENFGSYITSAWEFIKSVVSNAIDAVKNTLTTVTNTIKAVVLPIWEAIKNGINIVWETIKNLASTVWNGIKTVITNVVNDTKTVVTNVWNAIKSVTSSVFNAVKSVASSVWNSIKSVISSVVDSIKSVVSSVWNGIKSTTSSVFNSIKSTATSVWDSIKNAIEKPINAAKDAVKKAIDKIKSFFDFEWSLPKLKLPHIDISGKFSLSPPSVPKFGIEWYKDGGIMTDPTMFGFNGFTGKAMVGGEAGAEAIAPIDVLLGYVRTAVQEENAGLAYQIEKLIKMLEYYLPEVLKNMLKNIYLDTGVLVGELGGEIDNKLGNISKMKERGM